MSQKKSEKNIIAYVMELTGGAVESIRKYGRTEKKKFRVMLIIDAKHNHDREVTDYDGLDILIVVDFSKPHKIAEALLPYQN